MNWMNFRTYNEADSIAFEALCNYLFENWLKKSYKGKIKYFSVVNGTGGDGGVEAYAELKNGDVIAVQSCLLGE